MYIKLHDSYISIRNKPKNISKKNEHLYKSAYSKEIPSTYLYILNNVSVVYDTLYSIKLKKFFIEETHLFSSSFNRKNKIDRLLLFVKPYKKLDRGIWITMNWTEMYFHWISDALTRLVMVDHYMSGHKIILPESYSKLSYVTESLKLLGFEPFYYKLNKRISVDNIIIPSHVSRSGDFNKFTLLKLRNAFSKLFLENNNNRIFVSRKYAAHRIIENESDLYSVLNKFNIKIVHFENLTFENQVKLVSQSSFICGLHGAGFTNMLFMPFGSKVFEMQISDEQNNCFYSMSSELNFDYWHLTIEKKENGIGIVNPNEFEYMLDIILN